MFLQVSCLFVSRKSSVVFVFRCVSQDRYSGESGDSTENTQCKKFSLNRYTIMKIKMNEILEESMEIDH